MKRSKEPDVTEEELRQHSVKLTEAMEKRVFRCMKLEGTMAFANFARSALMKKCREIERDHGINENGLK